MSKIANNLRLMSSGPRAGFSEINLPARRVHLLCQVKLIWYFVRSLTR